MQFLFEMLFGVLWVAMTQEAWGPAGSKLDKRLLERRGLVSWDSCPQPILLVNVQSTTHPDLAAARHYHALSKLSVLLLCFGAFLLVSACLAAGVVIEEEYTKYIDGPTTGSHDDAGSDKEHGGAKLDKMQPEKPEGESPVQKAKDPVAKLVRTTQSDTGVAIQILTSR